MPLMVESMTLGQLRLKEKELQAFFWLYAEKYRKTVPRRAYRHWLQSGSTKADLAYQQFIAVGDMLKMVSDELAVRTYDYAIRMRELEALDQNEN